MQYHAVLAQHTNIFLPDIWGEGISNRISYIFFDFKMKKIECCLHRFHVIKKPRLYTYSLDTILTLPSSHFLVGKIPSRPDLSNSSMISHWETTAPILYTCSMISEIVINCASWKDLKRKIDEISKDYNKLVSQKYFDHKS